MASEAGVQHRSQSSAVAALLSGRHAGSREGDQLHRQAQQRASRIGQHFGREQGAGQRLSAGGQSFDRDEAAARDVSLRAPPANGRWRRRRGKG